MTDPIRAILDSDAPKTSKRNALRFLETLPDGYPASQYDAVQVKLKRGSFELLTANGRIVFRADGSVMIYLDIVAPLPATTAELITGVRA